MADTEAKIAVTFTDVVYKARLGLVWAECVGGLSGSYESTRLIDLFDALANY